MFRQNFVIRHNVSRQHDCIHTHTHTHIHINVMKQLPQEMYSTRRHKSGCLTNLSWKQSNFYHLLSVGGDHHRHDESNNNNNNIVIYL